MKAGPGAKNKSASLSLGSAIRKALNLGPSLNIGTRTATILSTSTPSTTFEKQTRKKYGLKK